MPNTSFLSGYEWNVCLHFMVKLVLTLPTRNMANERKKTRERGRIHVFCEFVTPQRMEIPSSLASLTSLLSFITEESKQSKPRLGLVSTILGELEETDGNFPLTSFVDTYKKYEEFLEAELRPCLQDNKAETVSP